jgi:mRNA interferase MazF
MGMVVKRFEVYYTNLEPTVGSEIRKVRPCIIISSDELNLKFRTVLIAPLTKTFKLYPTRVKTHFQDIEGYAALDQIRCIDKSRLKKKIGLINPAAQSLVLQTLQEMFEK